MKDQGVSKTVSFSPNIENEEVPLGGWHQSQGTGSTGLKEESGRAVNTKVDSSCCPGWVLRVHGSSGRSFQGREGVGWTGRDVEDWGAAADK